MSYFFVASLQWLSQFLTTYGSCTALLETIGLLFLFLCIPRLLVNQNILLAVDNEAVIYAWKKIMSPCNLRVSMLIHTLHLLEAALPCRIFIEHVPHCSTPEATLVDHLSRNITITATDLQKIRHITMDYPDGSLIAWLHEPTGDWTLPKRIVSECKYSKPTVYH
jgi:hypothetical protein